MLLQDKASKWDKNIIQHINKCGCFLPISNKNVGILTPNCKYYTKKLRFWFL